MPQDGGSTAKRWSLDSGECLRTLRGLEDAVVSAAFPPDGRSMLTAFSSGSSEYRLMRQGHGTSATEVGRLTSLRIPLGVQKSTSCAQGPQTSTYVQNVSQEVNDKEI